MWTKKIGLEKNCFFHARNYFFFILTKNQNWKKIKNIWAGLNESFGQIEEESKFETP